MKKLRIKFILICQASVFFVLLIILSTIIGVNYNKVIRDSNNVLDALLANDGKFDLEPIRGDMKNPPNKETPFETRYFSVKLGDEVTIDVTRIASVNEKEALNMANSIKKNNGFYGIYRYKVKDTNDYKLVVFVDCARSLDSIKNLIITSIWISLIGLLMVFILIFFGSKIILKPVIKADIKQKMFITNASHELKTPLTIISANNELIEIEKGDNEYSKAISKQITRLASMINNLTSLAKLDEDDKIMKNKVNISKLASEAMSSFTSVNDVLNIKFNYNIEEDLFLDCNGELISKLCYLLLDNAYKYSLSYIDFNLKHNGKYIEIVTKNDANIKSQNGNLLLERFNRGDSIRGEISGSGIGLSLVNEIVNLHNGTIDIDVKDGSYECLIRFK